MYSLSSQFKNTWFEHVGYKPHPGQLKLHFPEKADARFFVGICGRRWGKSMSASMEAQVTLNQPNKHVWIVAPTYDGSEKVFREIWEELIIKQKYDDKGFITRKSYKDQYIKFEWGSSLEGKSADKPVSLVGEGLDLLIIDEAAKIQKKIWSMYLRPTLSDRKGKCIMITTPMGFNWIYDNYLLSNKDDMWCAFNSPSWENTFAYPLGKRDPDLLEAKRNSDKEVWLQEYAAMFTALSGRIYDFDRDLDAGSFPYNPNYDTFCAIDFGYRMPAALWLQTYKKGGLWHINIIDEFIHNKNVKTDELVNICLEKERKYKTIFYYGDPSGMQAQGQSGLGDIEIFRNKGITVRSMRNKVSRKIEAGISHVRSFIENADGMRFVHVNNNCVGIIEDLESYRYPELKDGQDIKPEPLKDGRSDHGCDALRYFFVNRFPIKNIKIKVYNR